MLRFPNKFNRSKLKDFRHVPETFAWWDWWMFGGKTHYLFKRVLYATDAPWLFFHGLTLCISSAKQEPWKIQVPLIFTSINLGHILKELNPKLSARQCVSKITPNLDTHSLLPVKSTTRSSRYYVVYLLGRDFSISFKPQSNVVHVSATCNYWRAKFDVCCMDYCYRGARKKQDTTRWTVIKMLMEGEQTQIITGIPQSLNQSIIDTLHGNAYFSYALKP